MCLPSAASWPRAPGPRAFGVFLNRDTGGQVYDLAVFQAERHTCGSTYGLTLRGFARPVSVCAPSCVGTFLATDPTCESDKSGSGCKPGC